MTYGVTGWNNGGSVGRCDLVNFDTEAQARDEAEAWVRKGVKDVTVWKQVAAPLIRTEVVWQEDTP